MPPPSKANPETRDSLTGNQIPTGDVSVDATALKSRRATGLALGAVGILLVIAIGICAFYRLENLKAAENLSTQAVVVFGLKLFAEMLVSVALVYFGYQLLRVSERMLLPSWWVSESNVEVVRAMTGVDAPTTGLVKVLDTLARTLQKKSPKDKGKD